MRVEFDDVVADDLVGALREAADFARWQAWARTAAVTAALKDFQGGFADSFCDGAGLERDDRGRFALVLDDLADQVEVVKRKAREERKRLADLAAWEEREEARRRARNHAFATGGVVPDFAVWDVYDPRPDEQRIVASPLYAIVHVHPRPRSARPGAGPGGVTSADPRALVDFVFQWRGMEDRYGAELDRVCRAWSRFATSCSWVRIERVNLSAAFHHWVDESESWLAWISRIAAAFQTAGSTGTLGPVTLLNARLGVFLGAAKPSSWVDTIGLLLSLFDVRSKEPAQVATWWANLGSARQAAIQSLFPDLIRNLDGIPPGLRDELNRQYLANELERLRGLSAEELRGQESVLEDLEALEAAIIEQLGHGETPFLLGLDTGGLHVKAILALGDVSTADQVGVFVPGLGTTVRDSIGGYAEDMYHLKNKGEHLPGQSQALATVVWIGYDAPGFAEVPFDLRARAGVARLRSFTQGLAATGKQGMETTLFGHSYGSLVTGGVLQEPGHGVTRMVVLGSPGLMAMNPVARMPGIADGGFFPAPHLTLEIKVPMYVDEGSICHLGNVTDPVDYLGYFGTPFSELDNVTQLSTADSRVGTRTHFHGSYFEEGSTSLYNAAAVLADIPELTVEVSDWNLLNAGLWENLGVGTRIEFEGEQ